MRRFLFSLWFRLVLGFGLILAATLASVSFYIAEASEREAEGFERQQETVRRKGPTVSSSAPCRWRNPGRPRSLTSCRPRWKGWGRQWGGG